MKYQVGQVEMNKTKRFLVPCLVKYGEEFVARINQVTKIAMGVGDILLVKSGIHYQQHIFFLIDTNATVKKFKSFMTWLKNQVMYEDDYAFDSIHKGHLHMIVIKLPEECYKPAEWFKKSQFSKMFTKAEVEKYFKNSKEKGVLIKDHNYKVEFVGKLNDLFESSVKPDEYEGELDLPIRKEKEIFNT